MVDVRRPLRRVDRCSYHLVRLLISVRLSAKGYQISVMFVKLWLMWKNTARLKLNCLKKVIRLCINMGCVAASFSWWRLIHNQGWSIIKSSNRSPSRRNSEQKE